jgi:hypothetical protein
MTKARVGFGLAMLMFGGLVAASSAVGVPRNAKGAENLPAVALGWRLLFHIERAGAILGIVALVTLIAWRGAHGDWPIKFGNLEYAPKEVGRITSDALKKQEIRLRYLEDELGVADASRDRDQEDGYD